jgi:chromosome partitioning protein
MPADLSPIRPRIIAIVNQKGGVGKTTTAINLGAALARRSQNVVLVDLDPQGNASTGLGIYADSRRHTIYDVMLGDAPIPDAIHNTAIPGLSVIPATADLTSADIDLTGHERRSFLLHDALRQPRVADLGLDYVLIDCPPSLSMLTVNALVAAHAILVPLQAEFFALEGLSQLLVTLREVRATANPDLRIAGVVLTMADRRNNLAQQVESDARQTLGDLVMKTVIPRNVRVSEAPSFAMSVLDFDAQSTGARAYIALADELLSRENRTSTLGVTP